jgi:hypothetical protein
VLGLYICTIIMTDILCVCVVLGFELRSSHLLGRCSTTLPRPSALFHFCFRYFSGGISVFAWIGAQTVIHILMAS